jgi:hypothetical protein
MFIDPTTDNLLNLLKSDQKRIQIALRMVQVFIFFGGYERA